MILGSYDRGDLFTAVRALRAVAKGSEPAPARLAFAPSGLTLFGACAEMELTRVIPGELGGTFSTCVQNEDLASAVDRLPSGRVAISKLKGQLQFAVARTEIRVALVDEGGFPGGMTFDATGTLVVEAGELKRVISQTVYATDKDNSRLLGGVHVSYSGDRLRFVATDGCRLAWSECAYRGTSPLTPALLPPALLEAITRGPDVGEVELTFGDRFLRVTRAGEVIVGLLYEGAFPDYRGIIPNNNARHRARVQREQLLAALRRQPKSSSVRVECGAEGILLATTGRATNRFEATDTLPIVLDGDPIFFGANPLFLADAVAGVQSDEVELCLSATLAPVLISGVGDALHQAVVMPVRLE
jgi:DNA polymerase III sliding clamp (beta) subunit (PCNA family)